jgi:hypothetical protein
MLENKIKKNSQNIKRASIKIKIKIRIIIKKLTSNNEIIK